MAYILVGLGNPGEKYVNNRHNVGFFLLEHILEKNDFSKPRYDKYCESRVTRGVLNSSAVEVIFPETFMNESGRAVMKFCEDLELTEKTEIVVIHDEVDLEFGEIKISKDRGAGGHNGIRSLIKHLGTKDFVRIRVGVASAFWEKKRPVGRELNDFVLGNFNQVERDGLEEVQLKVERALSLIMEKGVEKAMEEINRKEKKLESRESGNEEKK